MSPASEKKIREWSSRAEELLQVGRDWKVGLSEREAKKFSDPSLAKADGTSGEFRATWTPDQLERSQQRGNPYHFMVGVAPEMHKILRPESLGELEMPRFELTPLGVVDWSQSGEAQGWSPKPEEFWLRGGDLQALRHLIDDVEVSVNARGLGLSQECVERLILTWVRDRVTTSSSEPFAQVLAKLESSSVMWTLFVRIHGLKLQEERCSFTFPPGRVELAGGSIVSGFEVIRESIQASNPALLEEDDESLEEMVQDKYFEVCEGTYFRVRRRGDELGASRFALDAARDLVSLIKVAGFDPNLPLPELSAPNAVDVQGEDFVRCCSEGHEAGSADDLIGSLFEPRLRAEFYLLGRAGGGPNATLALLSLSSGGIGDFALNESDFGRALGYATRLMARALEGGEDSISLAVAALEGLLVPSKSDGVSQLFKFRFARLASRCSADRKSLFDMASSAYRERSSKVHGSKKKAGFESDAERRKFLWQACELLRLLHLNRAEFLKSGDLENLVEREFFSEKQLLKDDRALPLSLAPSADSSVH